ncbi:1-acyl-sn-glycerol-3-phosphate acyltransferase [Aequorivita lipolytica]|uniref:Acyltransferase n=1 Tax=Aequorivita lipolytica TaxID=153267 RepID=A0A5C6YP85_9FLAO|nr:1-acyl-sn-glycerol-3-phosphate acyltransferase [Aequorivita lipolytica]TXD69170.1 acyltransferase [Aequorivita lipolytica]SRX51249.1 1-acyl-sn-glycerol-3-phosphate acyltransferase [Aequorivita lipolytica]
MGITKFIFEKLMGWRIEGTFAPAVKKAVIIVVPHTSWHDFYLGLFTRRLTKTQINYIAKKELFSWPFGWYFRWTGGVKLDRTPGQNKVEAIAEIFKKKDEFRLALSPEGTRKKVLTWKTGFYYIALAAKVPIICVGFDYKKKSIIINPAFYPSGNIELDSVKLRTYFDGVTGKNR